MLSMDTYPKPKIVTIDQEPGVDTWPSPEQVDTYLEVHPVAGENPKPPIGLEEDTAALTQEVNEGVEALERLRDGRPEA